MTKAIEEMATRVVLHTLRNAMAAERAVGKKTRLSFRKMAAEGAKWLEGIPPEILEEADKTRDGWEVIVGYYWEQFPKEARMEALELVVQLYSAVKSKEEGVEGLVQKTSPAMNAAQAKSANGKLGLDVTKKAIVGVIFAGMGVTGFAGLDCPVLMPVLLERFERACKENDLNFFIRFGRKLSESEELKVDRRNQMLEWSDGVLGKSRNWESRKQKWDSGKKLKC